MEQSQPSLSPGESDENRRVDLTKDPGKLGKTGDPGLRADLEGGGVTGKHGS